MTDVDTDAAEIGGPETADAPTDAGGRLGIARHVPNALTLLRLLIGLAFPLLPAAARLPTFLVGAASEFLDGFLARLWRAESGIGRALDPVADKIFVLAVFVTFRNQGVIELPQVALVLSRDIVVAAIAGWIGLAGHTEEYGYLRPRWPGKITTALQLVLLLSLFYTEAAHPGVLWLTVLFSGYAAVDYLFSYLRDIRVS